MHTQAIHQAFITGINCNISPETLKSQLSLICKGITKITIPNQPNSGYAFVDFVDAHSLSRFLSFKKVYLQGREVKIKKFFKGTELANFKKEVDSRRIFVYKIPPSWQDEDLEQLFSAFGAVETAYVIKKKDSRYCKGFGYVVYEDKKVVNFVLERKKFKFKGAVIKVKLHERKEKVRQNRKGKKNSKKKNFERIGTNPQNSKTGKGYGEKLPQKLRSQQLRDLREYEENFELKKNGFDWSARPQGYSGRNFPEESLTQRQYRNYGDNRKFAVQEAETEQSMSFFNSRTRNFLRTSFRNLKNFHHLKPTKKIYFTMRAEIFDQVEQSNMYYENLILNYPFINEEM
jgi:RNA recognition motif-containing protein